MKNQSLTSNAQSRKTSVVQKPVEKVVAQQPVVKAAVPKVAARERNVIPQSVFANVILRNAPARLIRQNVHVAKENAATNAKPNNEIRLIFVKKTF
ncbi:MAG: hypothetical protein PHD97_04130 [Bacteroidales bacterium]|nr:hypothetical protein [Bacteroidales bacterium]